MFRALEHPVLERGFQILKAVGAGRRRIGRAEEGVGRAKYDCKILGDTLGELAGDIALFDWRVVAGPEVIDGRKRQFVVDAGIVDPDRRRKEPVADDLVRWTLMPGKQRDDESGNTRAYETGLHG